MYNKRLLFEEYAARILTQRAVPNILDMRFQHQADFIQDPARKKVLFCTRRSAKSYTGGLYLHHVALNNPGCNCLFIGLTRESAKAIIWKDILKVINAKNNLNVHPNESELMMTHPNGSVIKVLGIDKEEDEMNKLLGRKFKLVVIDEASMYTISLSNLESLLEPSLVDEGGTLCLLGTASNFPRGLFYDITTGKRKDWKLFKWSAHDNPYVSRQWGEALKKIEHDRPEYMQTPQFKQWYLNQWVIDEEKLVYRFNMDKNLAKALPLHLTPQGWTYVLGVDTGWEDDSAFVLTAYHIHDPYLYVLKVFKQKRMTFDDVATKVQEFMKDPTYAPHKVIIDGANKQGVESMRQRSSIPFEYADKQDKVTFIELCNSDLIQGKIKILNTAENRPLWEEMTSLVWVTEGDKIKYPKKEHPSLPNHLCFVRDTPIRTPNGNKSIQFLKIGDVIQTRKGPRRIKHTMYRETNVVKLSLSDGRILICTPDHPFWSEGQWIEAQYLTTMDPLCTWSQLISQSVLSSMGSSLIEDLEKGISAEMLSANLLDYIKKSGRENGAISQKDFISIIRTMMLSTTDLRILNVCRLADIKFTIEILRNKLSGQKKILNELVQRHHSGINQKKAANGIENTANGQSRLSKPHAHGVAKNIKNHICISHLMDAALASASPPKDVLQESTISKRSARGVKASSSTINIQSSNAVVCVARDFLEKPEYVFNIEVEDQHEYFANDVLVSNCDGFLYSWRCGWHYASEAAPKKQTLYSPDWYKEQSDSIWERERDRLEQKNEWPEQGGLGDLG